MKKLILTLGLTDSGRHEFVSSIKALRVATGLGLKEAKDIVDSVRSTAYSAKRVVMFAQDVGLLMHAVEDGQRLFTVTDAKEFGEPDVLDLTVRSVTQLRAA